MLEGRIDVAIEDELAIITISRPEKLNSLTIEMVTALEEAARKIDGDGSIRAAIITGAGEKSFCAGGDITAWSSLSPEEFALSWIRVGHRAFDALARMRQPLIAALNGHTLGGGLEVAACADFRVAEDHVKVGLPEASIGIIPGWSGTQRAVRRFGSQAVRRMALLGETLNASEALGLGVVDRLVDRRQSVAAAKDMVAHIMARGRLAMALTKMMINAADGEDREMAIEALGGGFAAASPELKERIEAFRSKRGR
jgi:enoyl-CoA hydratase/carnithine racemase